MVFSIQPSRIFGSHNCHPGRSVVPAFYRKLRGKKDWSTMLKGTRLCCNPQTRSHSVCSFSPMPGFIHQSGLRIMILTSSIITSIPCIQQMTLEDCSWGWRNGSAVNRAGCSSRGPRFDSQDPPGSSQPSIAPVPGDLTTSAHLSETHMVPIHTCKQNSQINLKKKKFFFKA